MAEASPCALSSNDAAGSVSHAARVEDNAAAHTVTLTIPQAPEPKKFTRLKVVIFPRSLPVIRSCDWTNPGKSP